MIWADTKTSQDYWVRFSLLFLFSRFFGAWTRVTSWYKVMQLSPAWFTVVLQGEAIHFGFRSSVLLIYVSVCPDCGFMKEKSKRKTQNHHLSRRLSKYCLNASGDKSHQNSANYRFDCQFILK